MNNKVDWFVYLLVCADETLYCGATNNLHKRMETHNMGKASKYTRARLPVTLAAQSGPMIKQEALRLEAAIKKLPRKMKIDELLANNGKSFLRNR